DGRFEFPAVRAGEWTLNAQFDGARDGASPRGSAPLLVSRGDVDDIEVHVRKPVQVAVTVEWKGDDAEKRRARVAGRFGLIFPAGVDSNEPARSGSLNSDRVTFDNVLPGRYRLVAQSGLAAQTFIGDNEFTGAFEIAAGAPRPRIVLRTWAG